MEVFPCERRRDGWMLKPSNSYGHPPGPSFFLRAQTGRGLFLDFTWKGKLTKEMDVREVSSRMNYVLAREGRKGFGG